MIQKLMFLLMLIFGAPNLIFCQQNIQAAIDQFVRTPSLAGSAFSISVINTKTGEQLGAYQPDTRLTPASIQKLVTTAAALDILGPDFQFKTKLAYSGKIDAAGTLNGDLIILGGGDPSLASEELETVMKFDELLDSWANAIEKAGIKEIKGKIIGDGSHYQGYFAGPGWPWEDLGNYYGAGIWGLNIMENAFSVNFELSPERSQQPKLISTTPAIPNLLLLNELKTGAPDSGDQAYIFGGPFSYKRWIRGSLPQKKGAYTIYGSIPDPAFFTAFHLKERLETKGIYAQRASTNIDSEYSATDLVQIHEINSPRLSELVKAANHESINLYCEVFLREIVDQEKSGDNGLEKIAEWCSGQGLGEDRFILKDGSGLSPQNAFSANALSQLIAKRINDEAFITSLPAGGLSGTAKYIFKNSAAKGEIFVKSGSMSGVRAYAGVLAPKNGEQLAFCIIVNNFSCKSSLVRKEMEKLMEQFHLHR